MKITTDILTIDYKKRLEIMENTNYIKNEIQNEIIGNRFFDSTIYITSVLSKYKMCFDKYISELEKSCVVLYTLFPENKKFMKLLRNNEYDLEKVASLYCVNKSMVRIMYLNVLDINRHLNDEMNKDNDSKKKTL